MKDKNNFYKEIELENPNLSSLFDCHSSTPGLKNLQNFVYSKMYDTPQPKSCYVLILDCIFGGDVINTFTLCT